MQGKSEGEPKHLNQVDNQPLAPKHHIQIKILSNVQLHPSSSSLGSVEVSVRPSLKFKYSRRNKNNNANEDEGGTKRGRDHSNGTGSQLEERVKKKGGYGEKGWNFCKERLQTP